jgi:alcohol dehydrogenase class IV
MSSFSFATTKNIICEAGASSRLAEICQQQDITSVLLITDPGIIKLNLHLAAVAGFDDSSIKINIFSEVEADPSESVVNKAINLAKALQVDAIIGFGGGSSMDVAKIVALLAHPQCTQKLNDIYGVNNARGQRLPLFQLPTTAGTGSEVTQVSIVTTGETTKMGCVTPLFLPDFAILDAELTLGLPASITAATGIDAMVHAIEAYTSKVKKNPLSDIMAKEALKLLASNIKVAVHDGKNLQARENMLLGAMLAGQAFANSPVAAVHALAYPLGGHFHIPHGLSNSLILPHVMRFNLASCSEYYAELANLIFPSHDFSGSALDIAEQLISNIETLITDLALPGSLVEMKIEYDFLPTLAQDAMQQQRLLINNPRAVTYDDALAIYQAAYQNR